MWSLAWLDGGCCSGFDQPRSRYGKGGSMNDSKSVGRNPMDEIDGLSEDERLAKIRERESLPAINPRCQGLKPGEIARSLSRPRNPKITKILDALRNRRGKARWVRARGLRELLGSGVSPRCRVGRSSCCSGVAHLPVGRIRGRRTAIAIRRPDRQRLGP